MTTRRNFLRSAAAAVGGATGVVLLDKSVAGALLETGNATIEQNDIVQEGKIITTGDLVDEAVGFAKFADNIARILIASTDTVVISSSIQTGSGSKRQFEVRGGGYYDNLPIPNKQHDYYKISVLSPGKMDCACGRTVLNNKGPVATKEIGVTKFRAQNIVSLREQTIGELEVKLDSLVGRIADRPKTDPAVEKDWLYFEAKKLKQAIRNMV